MYRRPFEISVRITHFDIKNKKSLLSIGMSYTEKQLEREADLRKQVHDIAYKMLGENGFRKDITHPEYQVEILLGHTVDKLERYEELLNDCFYLLHGFSKSQMADAGREDYDRLMVRLTKVVESIDHGTL